MAATLDVTLKFTPSGGSLTTYSLQVEELVVNIRRQPLHQPIPGSDPLQNDFGLSDPNVRVRGILPIAPGSDGTNTICDKVQLEDVVTDHYQNDITLTIGAGSGDASAQAYVGKIQDFSATLNAGKEEVYWTYSLTLLAQLRS
tara:strand:- start:32631 stop:33059 length:429 start_codon:yes stop_codon:yes gene_type:complete